MNPSVCLHVAVVASENDTSPVIVFIVTIRYLRCVSSQHSPFVFFVYVFLDNVVVIEGKMSFVCWRYDDCALAFFLLLT